MASVGEKDAAEYADPHHVDGLTSKCSDQRKTDANQEANQHANQHKLTRWFLHL